jgi:hypothetical protein
VSVVVAVEVSVETRVVVAIAVSVAVELTVAVVVVVSVAVCTSVAVAVVETVTVGVAVVALVTVTVTVAPPEVEDDVQPPLLPQMLQADWPSTTEPAASGIAKRMPSAPPARCRRRIDRVFLPPTCRGHRLGTEPTTR